MFTVILAYMNKVEEMQKAISELPSGEFRRLADWIDEKRAADWDRQIEEDARSGKLAELYEKVTAEDNGDKPVQLNDFLDQQKLPGKV